jgi:hypothetical protein
MIDFFKSLLFHTVAVAHFDPSVHSFTKISSSSSQSPRSEMFHDLGDGLAKYDRIWTEIKTR